MPATREEQAIPHSCLLLLGIALVLACPSAQGQNAPQKPAEQTLVRVNITTETLGSPGAVVAYGGQPIPDYRPGIVETYPGIVIDDSGHVLIFLSYRWADVHKNKSRIEIVNREGKKFPGTLIGVDQSTRIAVSLCPKCGLTKTPVCDTCDIKDGVTVFVPLLEDASISQFESTQIRSVSTGSSGGAGWSIHVSRPLSVIGAPLVNAQHQVIGMVADRDAGGDPSSLTIFIAAQMLSSANKIIKTGRDIQTGWLGVSTDSAAETKFGVTISDIEKDSPAQKAGLLPGDVIVKWNGTAIEDQSKLIQMVMDTPVGSTANIELLRQGKPATKSVVIGTRKPQDPDEKLVIDLQNMMALAGGGLPTIDIQMQSALGIDVMPLTPQWAAFLQMPMQAGLLVSSVTLQAASDRAGVQAGDVILGIDGVQVGDLKTFYDHIKSRGWGSRLVLRLVRKGAEMTKTIQLPKTPDGKREPRWPFRLINRRPPRFSQQ